jgi:hypothetical protein
MLIEETPEVIVDTQKKEIHLGSIKLKFQTGSFAIMKAETQADS